MTTQKDSEKDVDQKDTEGGYQTPLDEMTRHTGIYEGSDAEDEARPEAGSSNTGKEGAPNQGTERR